MNTLSSDSIWDEVLRQAQQAAQSGEVPVGAVITCQGAIIAAGHNQVEALQDASAHAEMLVMAQARQALSRKYLEGCHLYVSLEPCAMCAGAIAHHRIERLYFGAYDPKSGGVEHGARVFSHPTCHHRPDIYGGIREQSCSALLTEFFASKRKNV